MGKTASLSSSRIFSSINLFLISSTESLLNIKIGTTTVSVIFFKNLILSIIAFSFSAGVDIGIPKSSSNLLKSQSNNKKFIANNALMSISSGN